MAEKEKKEPTLKDQWWRWHIIREVRVPTSYIKKAGKKQDAEKIEVQECIVKSVLLELAQWDHPDAEVYVGVEHIQHATGVPERQIYKAFRVLDEAGLLKRRSRGLGNPKLKILDWDKLEALREPFSVAYERKRASKTADASNTAGPSEQPFKKELPPSDAPPVTAALLSLPHVGPKLLRKQADTLAASLTRSYAEADLLRVIVSFDEKALMKMVQVARSLPAYLRDSIENKLRELADGADVRKADEPLQPADDYEQDQEEIHASL